MEKKYITISSNRVIKRYRVKEEWYNKIKRMFAFVLHLIAMSHEERDFCLKRLTVPRFMNISDNCTNIMNGNVCSDCAFIDKIRCREHVIIKFTSKVDG